MTDVDPEKATIGDLFRLMTSVKKTVDGHTNELAALRDDMSSVKGTVEAHTGELGAIRNVVDDDLASHDQMLRVEGDIVEIKKTQRQHGKKIDRLADSMDRAGIPVR